MRRKAPHASKSTPRPFLSVLSFLFLLAGPGLVISRTPGQCMEYPVSLRWYIGDRSVEHSAALLTVHMLQTAKYFGIVPT